MKPTPLPAPDRCRPWPLIQYEMELLDEARRAWEMAACALAVIAVGVSMLVF